MKIYTGIGPRNAPPKVLEVCEQIGAHMAKRKWRLRTGAGSDAVSSGCDLAFRKGAESQFPHQDCSIYLELFCPSITQSKGLECGTLEAPNSLQYVGSEPLAKALVRALHPKGKGLAPDHLELHARNVHQLIGPADNLDRKSNLLILWTPGGAPTEGGTGMTQKIAHVLPGRHSEFNIGMFDLDNPTDLEAMWAHLNLIVHSLEFE
jgi:hypothetical protein